MMNRARFVASAGAVTLLVVAQMAASASDVGIGIAVTEKHFSIEVPEGWSYERNVSAESVFFDVVMHGPPGTGGVVPVLAVGTRSWSGTISDEAIFGAYLTDLNGLLLNPDYSDFSFPSPPANITIDGEKAIVGNVTFQRSERECISSALWVVSDDWSLAYVLIFMGSYADWESDSETLRWIISTFDIEKQEEPADWTSISIVLMSVAVVAAPVVAVVLLLRRRRTRIQTMELALRADAGESFRDPGRAGPGELRHPEEPPGGAGGPVE